MLLGSILKYEDRIVAPVNLAAWDRHAINVPGMVVHAQALRNLLNDGLVQPVARWLPLALALAAALLWLWVPAPALALAALLCIWITGLALSTYALSRGVHMPVANIMCVTLIALGGRQALEAALNLRERGACGEFSAAT